ncbi:MAG TPA: alpha/beta hydrolase [Candidatus Saccharimonadales bacterium]|nr:alpha/beta hydrolase [Candidatus Saccharimonadales bacterium]
MMAINEDKITALNINRLKGRMLHLPQKPRTKKKKREILLLYGHHASLERMFGIADNLNRYGAVTIPDLPGFGGMESFYKIGLKPTIDNYADYLAAFIKLRYKRKRFTLVSMSFSFLVVTRMLQKYPDLAKKIDLLVSSVGFVHHEDFHLPRYQQKGLLAMGRVFQFAPTAFLFRYTILQGLVIKGFYMLIGASHSKMKDTKDRQIRNERIKAEIKLWHINDVRTRMKTMADAFKVDLCKGNNIDLPVYHVFVSGDRYFNNDVVEQHMRIIYKDFIGIETSIKGHMPSIVATAKEADPFVPAKLKKLLK